MFDREHEEARRLLVRAIASAKANEFASARRMLERVLRIPATVEQTSDAYYWLSEISDSKADKKDFLTKALGHNPANHLARKKLAILDGKIAEEDIIDPNNIERNDQGEIINREGKRYVCQNCGGRLTFAPDGMNLICEYCESVKQTGQNEIDINEEEFVIGIHTASGHLKTEAVQSFECTSCGAVFILPPQQISLSCPHCNTVYTISQSETKHLVPPSGILPFAVSEGQVNDILIEVIRAKGHDKPYKILDLSGVYLPVWTFDIGGPIKWVGHEYKNEQWIKVTNQKHVHFDNVPVPASSPLPFEFNIAIRKFNTKDILPFSPDYLADWPAETYQLTMADAAIEARAIAFHQAKKMLKKREGLIHLDNLNFSSAELIIESFQLILVPVWIGKYQYDKKIYHMTINGNSGEINLKFPPSKIKKFVNWLLEDD